MGASVALPGLSYDSYALVESRAGAGSRDDSLFSSVDTSLMSILDAAGDRALFPGLEADLRVAQETAAEALR